MTNGIESIDLTRPSSDQTDNFQRPRASLGKSSTPGSYRTPEENNTTSKSHERDRFNQLEKFASKPPVFGSLKPVEKLQFSTKVPSASVKVNDTVAATVPEVRRRDDNDLRSPQQPARSPQKFIGITLPARPSPKPALPPGENKAPKSSQTSFQVVIPATKKVLLAELKRSTDSVEAKLADIEQAFGKIGFSEAYRTDLDDERLKNAAQPKKRKVQRKRIKVDLGPKSIDPVLEVSKDLVHPRKQVQDVLTSRFQEQFNIPLTFATNSDRRLNGKFQFISTYILRKRVEMADPSSDYGCSCTGRCDPAFCQCLEKDIEDDHGKRTTQIQTYSRRSDGIVVLSEQYLARDWRQSEITECNQHCGCDFTCPNRVVQKGRTVPLEVFDTAWCGFGVRSSVDIYQGQFIDLYLGEIITEDELQRRESAQEEGASSYIYSLDWFTKVGSKPLHVDGENFGTAMRFVNHSCDPNAKSFTVLNHKADKAVYYLAFFAIRDIPAGTEIRIDYAPQEAGEYTELSKEDIEAGTVKCQCGAANCRGRLWRAAAKRVQRKKKIKKGGDD